MNTLRDTSKEDDNEVEFTNPTPDFTDPLPPAKDLDTSETISSNDALKSPKLESTSMEDDDDDDVDKEEPSPKKQKHLSSITTTDQNPDTPVGIDSSAIAVNGSSAEPTKGNGSGKKPKKKSNNVWVTKSKSNRKGKKKNKGVNNQNGPGDDIVFITPVPRFPDKNDDKPEMKICLSRAYKAEKVELSEDRLTAGSTKGYRMVRATRGVMEGAWYFEIKVVHLGETGHTRLGWSTDKGDLQAPVGYDGNSFGYRDIDGSKIHKALREKYGEEGYKEGDVIGFYINLPNGAEYAPKPKQLVWYKGQRYMAAPDPKEDPPKVVPGE